MSTRSDLRLYEEILLLALRDREGTIAAGSRYHFAVGGAVLAELLMVGRLEVDGSRRRLVSLASADPTGDPLLDDCLGRIAGAKRRASLQAWVSRLANQRGLKHRIAAGLCRRGVLRHEEGRILWIFTRRLYPELDPGPEREVLGRLEQAVFGAGEVDARTVVLLSLAHATGLLDAAFGRGKIKGRQKRIASVCAGEMTGRAAKQAVEAMQAAVMVSVIMPAVVTTTIAH